MQFLTDTRNQLWGPREPWTADFSNSKSNSSTPPPDAAIHMCVCYMSNSVISCSFFRTRSGFCECLKKILKHFFALTLSGLWVGSIVLYVFADFYPPAAELHILHMTFKREFWGRHSRRGEIAQLGIDCPSCASSICSTIMWHIFQNKAILL